MNRFAAAALLGAMIVAGQPAAVAGENNVSAQRAMLEAEWAKARARHAAQDRAEQGLAAAAPQTEAPKTPAPATKTPGS